MNKEDLKWLIQLIASIAIPLMLEWLRSKQDKKKPSSRKRRKHKRR